jgi:hypothetical protein
MYNETPNSNSKTGNVFVSSKYNGIELNDGYPVNQNKSFTAYVTNSNPTMSDVFSYSDTNPETVTNITNNNQRIIQNFSTVKVVLPVGSKATAKNGATITQYIATLNGVEKIAPYSDVADVTFEFGSINAVVDQTLTIKAVDSRGNSDEKSKTVFMIPYSLPTVNATAKRLSGFERESTLKMNGEFSLLTIDGVNKNTIESVQYRYKPTTVETYATWDTWQDFTWIITDNDYTATDVLLDLDNTISWHIEFLVTDILGNMVFSTTVGTGSPILYIDNARKSIGVGKFVEIPHSYSLDVEGIVKAQGFYGEHNQDNGIAEDYLNGNVAINALGGSLYLGFKGTTRITQRADLYDNTFSKVILTKEGVFQGTIQAPTNKFASDGGAIALNNSDIVGANAIYFNDTSGTVEGLNFIKTGATVGSTLDTDYDTFRILDGLMYLNGVKLFDRGSNANGNYVKFENGLMVCWRVWDLPSPTTFNGSVGHPNGGYYMYISSNWTYPVGFSNIPVVFNNGDFNGAFTEHHQAWTRGSWTECGIENGVYWSAGIDTTTRPALSRQLLAIGWWK